MKEGLYSRAQGQIGQLAVTYPRSFRSGGGRKYPMIHVHTYIEDITRWRENMTFTFEW